MYIIYICINRSILVCPLDSMSIDTIGLIIVLTEIADLKKGLYNNKL